MLLASRRRYKDTDLLHSHANKIFPSLGRRGITLILIALEIIEIIKYPIIGVTDFQSILFIAFRNYIMVIRVKISVFTQAEMVNGPPCEKLSLPLAVLDIAK